MITIVTFTGRNFTFVYEFLHVSHHPVLGISLQDGLRQAFHEFKRHLEVTIWSGTIRLSQRP
jgi:hypothetical protein